MIIVKHKNEQWNSYLVNLICKLYSVNQGKVAVNILLSSFESCGECIVITGLSSTPLMTTRQHLEKLVLPGLVEHLMNGAKMYFRGDELPSGRCRLLYLDTDTGEIVNHPFALNSRLVAYYDFI